MNRKGIKIVIIVAILIFAFGGIALFSLKEYHDNNSWASFEITGDGIAEGQTIYECSPDINVVEINGTKGYGKGESIMLGFASFTVERVDIGNKAGVIISSTEDLMRENHTTHRLYLEIGDSCEIISPDGRATITLANIDNQ